MMEWVVLWVVLGVIVSALLALAALFWASKGDEADLFDRSDDTPVRTLAGRIVLCANCERKTTLYTSSSGTLICSACGSECWTFYTDHAFLALEAERLEEAAQIRELHRLYALKVMPSEAWVEDAKRRAMAKVQKANRQDAKNAKGGE